MCIRDSTVSAHIKTVPESVCNDIDAERQADDANARRDCQKGIGPVIGSRLIDHDTPVRRGRLKACLLYTSLAAFSAASVASFPDLLFNCFIIFLQHVQFLL